MNTFDLKSLTPTLKMWGDDLSKGEISDLLTKKKTSYINEKGQKVKGRNGCMYEDCRTFCTKTSIFCKDHKLEMKIASKMLIPFFTEKRNGWFDKWQAQIQEIQETHVRNGNKTFHNVAIHHYSELGIIYKVQDLETLCYQVFLGEGIWEFMVDDPWEFAWACFTQEFCKVKGSPTSLYTTSLYTIPESIDTRTVSEEVIANLVKNYVVRYIINARPRISEPVIYDPSEDLKRFKEFEESEQLNGRSTGDDNSEDESSSDDIVDDNVDDDVGSSDNSGIKD